MAILKLVISDVWQRRTRSILTVLAIALSVSLVVAVTTGYSSFRGTIFKYFLEYVGRTDVEIRSRSGQVDESVIPELIKDPDVAEAVGRLEIKTALVDSKGQPLQEQATATFIGVRMPRDVEVTGLKMEPDTDGRWFASSRGNYAVIDQRVAELLKLKMGGEILLPAPPRSDMPAGPVATTNPFGPPLHLKVVAVVHKPQIAAFFHQTVYVPLETLQDFTGNEGKVTRVLIDLKRGVSDKAFVDRWRPTFPSLGLRPASESRKDVDKNLQGVEMLSYLGGTVSMLAATFIIFSTLSMGVVERQRALGMLRAVGATRMQLGWTVVFEGMVLAAAGAAVGVPLGLAWVKILVVWKPDYFQVGVVPSLGGIAYGTVGSIVAGMAASILPALMASRTDVIEAISATGQPQSARVPWVAALLGVLFVSLDPLLMFGPETFGRRGLFSDTVTYYAHFFVGIPILMLGFFLLAPAFVWAVEKTLGRVVSLTLGMRHSLLAQQLSGSIWRSAGTAAALMVGLAILVVMQTQGTSLLKGWRLPDRFPDIFIFSIGGMKPEAMKAIEQIKGIEKKQVLPIAFDRARAGLTISPIGATSTMFFGVDPDKGLQMMGLEFLEGSEKEARRLLESRSKAEKLIELGQFEDAQQVLKGTKYADVRQMLELRLELAQTIEAGKKDRAVQLLRQSNLRGKLNLIALVELAPQPAMQRIDREIKDQAVASLDRAGGYVIVTDELRQLRGLHKGSTIEFDRPNSGGVLESVKSLFLHSPATSQPSKLKYEIAGVIWSPGIDLFVNLFDLMPQFEERSLGSAFGTIDDARKDFGIDKIYLFAANLDWGVNKNDIEQRVKQTVGGMGLLMGDVRLIKWQVTQGFERLLDTMSLVPMAAIIVAALGVANTIIASVRTRRWQLGVLRSVGLTRAQMLRLILSEGVLLGLIACALGLTAGLLMSLDANEFGWWVLGYKPKIVVPWARVGAGVIIILAVAVLASLWPAVTTARKEPLELLQGGRAG